MADASERFRLVRNHLGETQKSMSSRLGLSENTWQTYERGLHFPKFEILETLAKLGFRLDWIVLGEGAMLAENFGQDAPVGHSANRELMGRCIDAISKLYQELNIKLSLLDMGREAADLHDEVLTSGAATVEEYLPVIRVLIAQRRRTLIAAPTSGKLQDSA